MNSGGSVLKCIYHLLRYKQLIITTTPTEDPNPMHHSVNSEARIQGLKYHLQFFEHEKENKQTPNPLSQTFLWQKTTSYPLQLATANTQALQNVTGLVLKQTLNFQSSEHQNVLVCSV